MHRIKQNKRNNGNLIQWGRVLMMGIVLVEDAYVR